MTPKPGTFLVLDTSDNYHLIYENSQCLGQAMERANGAAGCVVYMPAAEYLHVEKQLCLISDLVDDEKVYGSVAALMDAVRGALAPRPPQPSLDLGLIIHQIPELSTYHLDKKTADVLLSLGNQNPWVPCAAWENGFFLFLDEIEDALSPVPQCLTDVRDWRRALEDAGKLDNSRWVRFDADSAVIEGIPTYEW